MISLVAHTKLSGIPAAPTPPIDTTGANLLIGYCSGYGVIEGDDPPTVSDNKGNFWTVLRLIAAQPPPSTALFYCYRPGSVGPGHTVTVNSSYASIFVAAFKGINPAGGFIAETGLGTKASTISIQPGPIIVSPGDLLVTGVGHYHWQDADLPQIDSGFVIIDATPVLDGDHYGGSFAYLIAPASGAVDPSWSLQEPVGSGLATSMAGFSGAAGAAGSASQPMAVIV